MPGVYIAVFIIFSGELGIYLLHRWGHCGAVRVIATYPDHIHTFFLKNLASESVQQPAFLPVMTTRVFFWQRSRCFYRTLGYSKLSSALAYTVVNYQITALHL